MDVLKDFVTTVNRLEKLMKRMEGDGENRIVEKKNDEGVGEQMLSNILQSNCEKVARMTQLKRSYKKAPSTISVSIIQSKPKRSYKKKDEPKRSYKKKVDSDKPKRSYKKKVDSDEEKKKVDISKKESDEIPVQQPVIVVNGID
jgi:hypothetical protein